MQRFFVPLLGAAVGILLFVLALHLYADHQHDDLMRAIQRQAIEQQRLQQQQQAK